MSNVVSYSITNFNVLLSLAHCGTTPLGKDDYYCNEDLVKQLVFDAKLSTPYFRSWDATQEERDLAQKYNVSVRFIATSSGLTRWHYVFEDHKNEWVDEFGNRAKKYQDKLVFIWKYKFKNLFL